MSPDTLEHLLPRRRCNMHIYSSAGLLRAGRYGDLELTGNHELESGVQFVTCQLAGSAIMQGCNGVTLISKSAHVLCIGDMHIDTLCGFGNIEVAGSLHCRCIDFTGKISVRDSIACKQSLDVTGILTAPGGIATHSMHIAGALLATDVTSMRMSVVRMGDAMYVNKLTPEYRTRSVLESIVAHRVSIEDVSCEHVHADHVTLRRCDVACLAYSHSFELDHQSHISHVTLTTNGQNESYRRRA